MARAAHLLTCCWVTDIVSSIRVMKFFLSTLLVAVLAATVPPFVGAAVREDIIESARKDGEVVFYTTTNLEDAGAMSRHFTSKYPFLNVSINRAEGERIITKV